VRFLLKFESIADVVRRLGEGGYVADLALATSLFLSVKMGRPLFLEGAPGVGKTELARVVSKAFDTELIRLQCYEGLDLNQAVYEWNYPRQLLALHARPTTERGLEDIFSEAFLLRRPLLRAIDAAHVRAPVLLIDELDRADEEFESFLLELLSEFQITIPELGTVRAVHRPIVLLTSNRTREVHDALKRRCIYHFIDYPSFDKELSILQRKVPGLPLRVQEQVVSFVQRLRAVDLNKVPGIAETIDWAEALQILGTEALDRKVVGETLGFFLKYQDDLERVRGPLADELLEQATGT
jgi:MoxR-like ATPase